jgi:hypothetical protein
MSNQTSPAAPRRCPSRPRGRRLLLGHGGVEAVLVDRDAARTQRVLGQVIGEAIGVIELERRLAGQRTAFGQVQRRFVEQLEALVQRLAELGFLTLQHILDQRLRAAQFGIGRAHFGDQRGHQTVHQRLPRNRWA